MRTGLTLALLACSGVGDARQRQADGAKQCIDAARIVSQEAAGPDAVRFRMLGKVDYVSRVPGCQGIAHVGGFNAIAVERRGTDLCRGDFVRAFDPAAARAGGLSAFPRCALGSFTPVPRD